MKKTHYQFKLYITGNTPKTEQLIANLCKIFYDKLGDDYELTVIDVLEDPQKAEADKILVTPTLIKEFPPPAKRIIGDLSEGKFLELEF
jgi:circadian clock protein KaiB